jgi:hypothetical protein
MTGGKWCEQEDTWVAIDLLSEARQGTHRPKDALSKGRIVQGTRSS